MRNSITITLLIVTLIIAGCSGKVSVTGKVTFSDDGEPVTKGIILFETEKSTLHASIKKDGTFIAGSTSHSDGIPKGEYKIKIIKADIRDTSRKYNPDTSPVDYRIRLIDPKYEAAATSGLTVSVTGATVCNLVVDRCPPEKAQFKE